MGMAAAVADMMPHSAAPTTRLIASAFTGHLPIVMYCEASVIPLLRHSDNYRRNPVVVLTHYQTCQRAKTLYNGFPA